MKQHTLFALAIGISVAGLMRCKAVEIDGPKQEVNPSPVGTDTTTYTCEGKTVCGQMKTCNEAKFYLANCPDTDGMDSDADGIPCEELLCH